MRHHTVGIFILATGILCGCPLLSASAEDLEKIKISSAASVLEAVELPIETKAEMKAHLAPNGQTIRTFVLDDWADQEEEEKEDAQITAILPAACTPKPDTSDGATFGGTSREVAKTRTADAPLEEANLTVKAFHASHPSDAEMEEQNISRQCDTARVDAEKRNVTVAAYLVAAKKEEDNDYHLIVQDKGCKKPECRLTVEVSGLPRLSGSKGVLKTARQYFEEQWTLYSGRDSVPGSGKYVFFETPVLVRVTGSIFYDADHPINPDKGTGPVGPKGYKPGSTWEIHPVTNFEFAPQTEVSLFALMNRNANAE